MTRHITEDLEEICSDESNEEQFSVNKNLKKVSQA